MDTTEMNKVNASIILICISPLDEVQWQQIPPKGRGECQSPLLPRRAFIVRIAVVRLTSAAARLMIAVIVLIEESPFSILVRIAPSLCLNCITHRVQCQHILRKFFKKNHYFLKVMLVARHGLFFSCIKVVWKLSRIGKVGFQLDSCLAFLLLRQVRIYVHRGGYLRMAEKLLRSFRIHSAFI